MQTKVNVVYPFVKVQNYQPRKKDRIFNSKYILYVGRLERRKGVNILLKAFLKISNKYPDIKLLMIGRDTETFRVDDKKVNFRRFFKKVVRNNRDRVIILNHVKNNKLSNYYKSSMFCVFPSLYEPFGMTIIEAMIYKKAVITCKAGGPSEYIKNKENGFLVKPSVEELIKKMNTLIKNSNLRQNMGERAFLTVKKKFSESKKCKQLEDIYLRCISAL